MPCMVGADPVIGPRPGGTRKLTRRRRVRPSAVTMPPFVRSLSVRVPHACCVVAEDHGMGSRFPHRHQLVTGRGTLGCRSGQGSGSARPKGATRLRWSAVHAVTIVDGSLVWAEREDPRPGRGELLVKVRAAGVNGADLLQRRGLYPPPPGVVADVPGLELAGEVVALGDGVRRFAPGDRVMSIVAGGGQAELVVVPETSALRVPDAISDAEAGGFPEVFSTAHDALVTQAALVAGERVLVTGAAGGVGTAAVQLAHALGATVVASVRSPEARPAVVDLGADVVVDPADAANAGPYDVCLELVGAPSLVAALPAMTTGGRVVVIGVGAGARLDLDLLTVMGKRLRIGGSTLRARSLEDKAAVAAGVTRDVLPLVASGAVRVPVWATMPMAEAQEAYDRFAGGGKVGKLVLLAD